MPISVFVKTKDGVADKPIFVLKGANPSAVQVAAKRPIIDGNLPTITRRKTPWGSIIRDIRSEQNLSQRQLAELSGVNRNVLRRIENDGGSTSMEVMERLGEILGYDLELICVKKSLH